MVYMATSLAVTAGGILLCYLLLKVVPVSRANAQRRAGRPGLRGWSFGSILAVITIFSEGALLLVAAQTGFVDGPRSSQHGRGYWFPHRFASLSDRFTIQNGVILMGGAAVLLLFYSHGKESPLSWSCIRSTSS